MTPPVGSGGRLVHLPNSTLLGVCSKEILLQLDWSLFSPKFHRGHGGKRIN